MKKVGLIPCRLESTRLPNKPLELIYEIPMFAHVYYRSKYSILDEVYICTDSTEIMKISKELQINAILTKSEHQNGTERCAEASQILELGSNDIVIDIQGDEPLLNPNDINNLINFFDPKKHDIVLGYLPAKIKKNVNTVKVVLNKESQVLYLSRQDIPLNFRKNFEMFKQVGLVGFTSESIQKFAKSEQTDLELTEGVELLRALEMDLRLYGVMLDYENRSVDTPDDLEFVRNKILDDELFLKYKKNETR